MEKVERERTRWLFDDLKESPDGFTDKQWQEFNDKLTVLLADSERCERLEGVLAESQQAQKRLADKLRQIQGFVAGAWSLPALEVPDGD